MKLFSALRCGKGNGKSADWVNELLNKDLSKAITNKVKLSIDNKIIVVSHRVSCSVPTQGVELTNEV